MHLDQATATDLLHELEACQPDAQVRIAQQSTWPSRHRPRHGRGPVDLDDTSLVDLGQGTQLGNLPEPVREQLGS